MSLPTIRHSRGAAVAGSPRRKSWAACELHLAEPRSGNSNHRLAAAASRLGDVRPIMICGLMPAATCYRRYATTERCEEREGYTPWLYPLVLQARYARVGWEAHRRNVVGHTRLRFVLVESLQNRSRRWAAEPWSNETPSRAPGWYISRSARWCSAERPPSPT